jgi:hypothetical protein
VDGAFLSYKDALFRGRSLQARQVKTSAKTKPILIRAGLGQQSTAKRF